MHLMMSLFVMEPDGSLPIREESGIVSYPEPPGSSFYTHVWFKNCFATKAYLSTSSFQSRLFLSDFQAEYCISASRCFGLFTFTRFTVSNATLFTLTLIIKT
jgi:hypothetical protein